MSCVANDRIVVAAVAERKDGKPVTDVAAYTGVTVARRVAVIARDAKRDLALLRVQNFAS